MASPNSTTGASISASGRRSDVALMRLLRRLARILLLTLTICLGVLIIGLIYTQTPWFKDWLRRYIVREATQVLNGELTIGRLSGSLFFGVAMSDITLSQQ